MSVKIILGISLALVMLIGLTPLGYSEPLRNQLDQGLEINDLQCDNTSHVLVIRTNGNMSCVSERTAEKLGWDIIKTSFQSSMYIIKPIVTLDVPRNVLVGDTFNVDYTLHWDPAFNEPYPEEIQQFQRADIIFINGAGYEKWIEKISLSTRKLVNTSSSFEDRYIETEDATHSHGPEGEHSHTELAFTTWLDLGHARAQAKSVLDHLIDYFPENKTEFQAKFVELTADLLQLESELRLKINSLDNKTAYASHPVYQYLGAGYGLEIISFHWEPAEHPSEEQWEEFTATHHEFQAAIMLWEDEPLPEVIDHLTEMDIRVVVFKPLGNIPENGDFISIMSENIEDLVK